MVDGVVYLLGRDAVPSHWKHRLLWEKIHVELMQLGTGQLEVHKVHAHGDESLAEDSVEEWLIRGNAKADAAAAAARQLRSDLFRAHHAALCAHHDVSVGLVDSQIRFLLDVSRFDLEHKGTVAHIDPEDLPLSILVQNTEPNDSNLAVQFEPDLLFGSSGTLDSNHFESSVPNDGHLVEQFDLAAAQLPDRCPIGFSKDFSARVLNLILSLDVSAARCRLVTGIELLAAFEALNLGSIPFPRIVNGVTLDEDPHSVVAGGLMRHTIASATMAFRKCLVQILDHFGVAARTGLSNRPDLGLVQVWSIQVGWPDHVESVARVVLDRWFSTRVARRACDLARPM